MNKKILTVLLALAMMLSMVAPMAAFAEGCEHKNTILNPNGNGTHSTLCEKCYATLSTANCTYGADNLCTVCGYPNPDAPAGCNHAGAKGFDNGDGTHKLVCLNPDCNGFVVTPSEPHNFDEDGVCVDCGAKKACEHKHHHPVDNKNQTHSWICDDCGKVLEDSITCIYVDGKCVVCKSLEPKKCEHANKTYTKVDEKSHEVSCADCKETLKKWEAHEFVDGKCKCGFEEPVKPCKHENPMWKWDEETETHYQLCQDCGKALTEPEACTYGEDGKCTVCNGLKKPCEHKKNHIVDNQNQTHSLVCDECDEVLEGPFSCIYVNGKCAVCKSLEPAKCEHAKKIYTPVKDGKTHQVRCADCGETLKEWEAHDFVDHKCTKCGYEEPVEPCKHEHTIWVWNEGDGTHYQLCEDCADILTDPEACTYKDGVCTVCGGLEHAEPDPDLDDVPKTGSFFLEWLYSVIF